MPMPKKTVSTTKFHTVKKRRQPGPSWKADCARMKKHQLKIAARTSSSVPSLTHGDEVNDAARTCRSPRNAAQPARVSTQQKCPTPDTRPIARSEYVVGGAHSLRAQGGDDGGRRGGGESGGGAGDGGGGGGGGGEGGGRLGGGGFGGGGGGGQGGGGGGQGGGGLGDGGGGDGGGDGEGDVSGGDGGKIL